MAVRYVVQEGAKVLREIAKPVKRYDEALARLLEDMGETLVAEEGVGLAAPQIGVSERVVVISLDEDYFEMVNPVMCFSKGEQTGPEGCLSVKGKQGTVTRPQKVKVEYRDRRGKKHTLTAEDFLARAVCHELDHLDGKLYTDIALEVYDLPPEDETEAEPEGEE